MSQERPLFFFYFFSIESTNSISREEKRFSYLFINAFLCSSFNLWDRYEVLLRWTRAPFVQKYFFSGLAEESFFLASPSSTPQSSVPQSRPVGITWFISNALDLSFQDKVFVPWSDKYKSMTIVCRPAASSLMTSKDPHQDRTKDLERRNCFHLLLFLSCARLVLGLDPKTSTYPMYFITPKNVVTYSTFFMCWKKTWGFV